MAGLIASLMAMWWFNRKDRYVASKHDQKFDREFERRFARGGFVSYAIIKEIYFLHEHDRLAMLDRVAGTLDRDSPEWKATYHNIYGTSAKRYIDGYEYNVHDYLDNEYCMKVYGKKYPSSEAFDVIWSQSRNASR